MLPHEPPPQKLHSLSRSGQTLWRELNFTKCTEMESQSVGTLPVGTLPQTQQNTID